MKVLVHFHLNKKYDNFEGARLRKTIKGALEVSNIPYTDVLYDTFDVAHFVYVEEDNIIDELKEKNIPIIVSALYCEDDPNACYLDYKDKNNPSNYSLKPKMAKFLNKANLVLVPNENAKELLIKEGIITPIEVCHPGINFARFDFSRDDEKDIFYRYFNCDRDKKITIAVGRQFNDPEILKILTNTAKVCEDVNFYYFASEGGKLNKKMRYKKMKKNLPSNVIVSDIVPDDIYRSALLNADVFLVAGQKVPSMTSILEAMAAKCQVIVRRQDTIKELTVDKKTAYVAFYGETIERTIKDYFEEKIKPTIDEAYEFASNYNINVLGENLQKIYQRLIDKKGD